jgi:hypothetical protein
MVAVLVGCGGGGGGTSTKAYPQLRAVNASPDSGTVDFLLNDTKIASAIGYLGSSADFVKYKSEDYDLTVKNPGAPESLDVLAFTPPENKSLIALISGLKDFGTEFDKRVRVTNFQVDRTIPNGSKARLIVLNAFIAASGASNQTIDFQDGDRPRFPVTGLDFDENGVVEVDAGTYTYEARRADSDLIYVSSSLTFQAGKIYLVVISGQDGGTGALEPKITPIVLKDKPIE